MTVPQHEQVLRMLRDAGSKGVHTAEIRRFYIANVGERRAELERLGHVIHSRREQSPYGVSWGARYFLVHDADSGVSSLSPVAHAGAGDHSSPPEGASEPASLFELPAQRPGHWDTAA